MAEFPPGLSGWPAAEGVRFIALSYVEDARAALARLDDAEDREALHDFRVGLRRLRSTLRAYRPHLSKAAGGKLRRRVGDVQRPTNAGRDAEVALEWLDAQRADLKPRERVGLTWLSTRLAAERDAAYAAARTHLAEEFTSLEQQLTRRLGSYKAPVRSSGAPAGPWLGGVCADVARGCAADLRGALDGIATTGDQAAAHRARILAKRLRYLLEPLGAEVPEGRPVVKRLKALQDLLGELHDAQVLAGRLAEASELAAVERARRQLEEAMERSSDDSPTGRASRRDERYGLLALATRNAARAASLFDTLREEWLEGRAASFFTLVELLADRLAAAASGLEIERKYLLSALPDVVRDAPANEIEQGWLPGTRLQERLRRVQGPNGDRFYRTIKAGAGIARLETEEETTSALFAALWPLTEGRRVRKRRYTIDDGGVWEVDEFLDRNLVLAEIELPSPDADVPIPPWLAPAVVREVTSEAAYLNVNLAR